MKYKNSIKKEKRVTKIILVVFGSIIFGLLGAVIIIYSKGAKITFHSGISVIKTNEVEGGSGQVIPITPLSIEETATPETPQEIEPAVTKKPETEAQEKKDEKKEISDYLKAVYVNPSSAVSKDKTEKLVDLANTTEVNAFVVNVKDESGYLTFDLGVDQAKKIGAVKKNAPRPTEFLKTLKDNKIYSIARIVVFKDELLANSNDSFTVKTSEGKIVRDSKSAAWVNPYKKEVWDYEISIAKAAIVAGFDEVQLEYVRFNADTKFQRADYGETAKETSKSEIIVEFTKKMFEEISASGGMLSLSLYGAILSSEKDSAALGQDYAGLSECLDYICPMIYPASYALGSFGKDNPDLYPYDVIKGALEQSINKQSTILEGSHKAIVRPWLQGYTASGLKKHQTYGQEQVKQQIQAVYDTKYENWMIWNGNSSYSADWFEK